MTGHDPATGKELWRADGLNPTNNPAYRIVASPFVFGEMIYAPTRERPLLALKRGRPRRRHDVAPRLVVRQRPRRADAGDRRQVPLRGARQRRDVLPRRQDGQDDLRAGAPAAGDLQRLAGAGRRQDLRHQRGRRDGGRPRPARSSRSWPQNDFGEYTLSSPAISEGQIFIRTDKALYAIGRRSSATD